VVIQTNPHSIPLVVMVVELVLNKVLYFTVIDLDKIASLALTHFAGLLKLHNLIHYKLIAVVVKYLKILISLDGGRALV